MKKLLSFILLLIYQGCTPPSLSPLEKNQFSGIKILIVPVSEEYKKSKESSYNDDNIDKLFSLSSGFSPIKYNDLVNLSGEVLGVKKDKSVLYDYLILKMDDGRELKMKYKRIDSELNRLPKVILSTDELTKVQGMVGRKLWLNKTKNFLVKSFSSFITDSNYNFERFEEVEVLEIYPYRYGDEFRPLWYKIKSKNGDIGYLKHHSRLDNEVGEIYYFEVNPLRKEWGDKVDLIKQGKIRVGMTKEQVRISWGNPNDINRTTTMYGTREQWVYKGYDYDRDYVYFDGDICTTIQN